MLYHYFVCILVVVKTTEMPFLLQTQLNLLLEKLHSTVSIYRDAGLPVF